MLFMNINQGTVYYGYKFNLYNYQLEVGSIKCMHVRTHGKTKVSDIHAVISFKNKKEEKAGFPNE